MAVALLNHPFKDGVKQILRKHFGESIARRFVLVFEANIFNKESPHIWKQMKDDQLILEVRYNQDSVLTEYICDLYPWESKKKTEAHLLRFITDAYKSGKIGKDWEWNGHIFKINKDIVEGKHETPNQ